MLFGMVLAVAGTVASSVDTDTPPPILTATPSQMDSKAPAFLANGVLGVRVPPNPLVAGSGPGMDGGGSALVMGFYKVMGGTIGNQPSPAPAPLIDRSCGNDHDARNPTGKPHNPLIGWLIGSGLPPGPWLTPA